MSTPHLRSGPTPKKNTLPARRGGLPLWCRATFLHWVLFIALATTTLWHLGDTPPGLFIDEAAIALTARSLWETGRDMLGTQMPFFPISFPDAQRPMPINPVYTYASIPFAVAGNSAWHARLPAVLWLWAAAAGIGLCAHELTGRRDAGIAISAIAVMTPWIFVLGRVGWEAVSFPAVLSFALWLWMKGARQGRQRLLSLSGILFGLSLYTYTTARLVVPLTLLGIWLAYARSIPARRLFLRLGVPVALMAMPLVAQIAFNPRPIVWRFEALSLPQRMAEAGPAAILSQAASNLFSYFSPVFLFLDGDPNLRHGTGRGVLFWSLTPLLVAGLREMWRRRKEPAAQTVAIGLLCAPAGAALLATQHPHAIRSIGAVVFWLCLAAMGIPTLFDWLAGRPALRRALALAVVLECSLFLGDYFGGYRNRAYDAFDTGRVDVLRRAFAQREGRHIYLTPSSIDDAGDGVLLAYLAGLPATLWIEAGLDAQGMHVFSGDAPPGSLVVIRAGEPFPRGAQLLHDAKGPDGVRRFALYLR